MLNLSLLLPLLKNLISNKIFIGLVVLASLFSYHKYETAKAFKQGGASVQAKWNQDIEIRNTAFLALKVQQEKDHKAQEQRFKDAQTNYDAKIKDINAKYAASSSTNQRLRNQLSQASTAGLGATPTTQTQCSAYVQRIDQISGLLSEGTELLGEGRRYVEELAAKVEALQQSR